jgi:hypothetical protein
MSHTQSKPRAGNIVSVADIVEACMRMLVLKNRLARQRRLAMQQKGGAR